MERNKSFINRILCFIVCAFLVCSALFTAVSVKGIKKAYALGGEIRVFSVSDYIDYDILDEFEDLTGIHVDYVEFATNEEMYNELKKAPHEVDLICPSEYMIMKMREENLIREFDTPQNFIDYGSPYIKEVFKKEPLEIMSDDESKTYSVGYMWGTVGMIFNTETVDEEDLKNWDSIWTHFNKRVTIKDSIRDTYLMALAYVYKTELLTLKDNYENGLITTEEYNAQITEIFNRTDVETVNKVYDALINLKPNLYGFEVDGGKADVLTGKIDVNVAWSGDAVYSISEGMFDEDGNDLPNPVYLGYAIPEEGSNVWFDGYVMAKYANVDNASAFLNYLADPEIAVRNMDYTGYTSCIAGDDVFDYVKENYHDDESDNSVDLKYFFDPDCTDDSYVIKVAEGLEYMFYAQYPTEDVIERCAVMKNFSGEELERINEMWMKIKLITLSDGALWGIAAGIVVFIAGIIVFKYRRNIFGSINIEKRSNGKYKKIKTETVY